MRRDDDGKYVIENYGEQKCVYIGTIWGRKGAVRYGSLI